MDHYARDQWGNTMEPWPIDQWGDGFTVNLTWGNIMRVGIIRSVAIATAVSGTILAAAGVAAADQSRPTGGDDPSAQSSCNNSSDLDFERGCFLSWGPFFK
jgi:hypothetical protein